MRPLRRVPSEYSCSLPAMAFAAMCNYTKQKHYNVTRTMYIVDMYGDITYNSIPSYLGRGGQAHCFSTVLCAIQHEIVPQNLFQISAMHHHNGVFKLI